MKSMYPISAALVAAIWGMGLSADAAAEITRQNASGMCQGALPAFDTQIRKRPLAVRNEGTQGAFVSCSLPGTGTEVHSSVELVFTNSSPVPVQVSCTVVSGRTLGPAPLYYPQTVDIEAGELGGIIQYFDNAIDAANLINTSCFLPPGVSFDYIRHDSVDPV